MVQVVAIAKNIRQSPRKVRVVVNSVKNLPIDKALAQLTISPKKAAKPIRKILESAIANAKENFKLDKENLKIKTLEVGPARTLRRIKPRAKGRTNVMRRRSCHIRVVLERKE
ncbi:MAG: 50S ribosomal protein L22 [Candidatus Cloacimonetes bacterium]|nr:50S ribosomal protein L22 [Candidatus Cloacimonadota bacterium]